MVDKFLLNYSEITSANITNNTSCKVRLTEVPLNISIYPEVMK